MNGFILKIAEIKIILRSNSYLAATYIFHLQKLNYIRPLLYALLVLLITGGLIGCSTKKNKWLNRTFHNITSKYNGYFNGEETIKEAVATLRTGHVDNYIKVLPVYDLGSLEDSKTIIPLTDKAIKKASVVISRHSMMIKGKEYCKYIDDSYLLIGKSMFYKRDYYASLEMFAYVAREPVKNNKKDPIQHRANIWLCRAYSELGMFTDARLAIDRSLNDKTLPKNIKGELYTALTDFHLKQNHYAEGLESITEALKYVKKKKDRVRLLFIRGQLLQKAGEIKQASDSYSKVLKSNPTYEMSFYARINIARCFDSENKKSTEIRALLAKMLADPKNIDYKDQIYYVLGELDEKEGNETRAIEQYTTSVQASTTNVNQKGMSYLAIAEIYFDQREYRIAAAYYDSTISSLQKDFPDYKIIENKRNSLAELVKMYEKIELYDSLLSMAKLNPAELDKKAEQIFKKEEEARRKQKEKDAILAAKLAASGGNTSAAPGIAGNGSWYFYNTSTMSFGYTEFRKVWGDRKLEDNWRRSNKQTVAPISGNPDEDTTGSDVAKEEIKLTREDSIALIRKKLEKSVPKNDTMLRAYADSVMEGYYDLGLIYKERLADLKKAAETYEDFLKRYPNNSNEPTIFYQLYRIYLAMPDNAKAEDYKNRLISKYPNSEYTQIVTDPEFFKRESLSKSEAVKFYEETYRLYQARQYAEVINRCRTSETRYQGNALAPKFALIKALAIGQTRDVDAFKSSLQFVVKNYPTDSVKTKAAELLNSLSKFQGTGTKDSVAAPTFSYKADTLHYYVVMVESVTLNLNDVQTRLSDLNTLYYSLKDLKINPRLLGKNYQIVSVQVFLNRKEASDYMKMIDDDDLIFQEIDPNILDTFIISAANFNTLMKNSKVEEYLDFYKRVYQ